VDSVGVEGASANSVAVSVVVSAVRLTSVVATSTVELSPVVSLGTVTPSLVSAYASSPSTASVSPVTAVGSSGSSYLTVKIPVIDNSCSSERAHLSAV